MLRLALAGHVAIAQVPEPPLPAAPIEWHVPPSCPDRAALVRAVEARLGRALRAGELALAGVVEAHPSAPLYRLTLRLRVGAHSEQRSLGAETCSALVDATAVLAALVVENNPRPPGHQVELSRRAPSTRTPPLKPPLAAPPTPPPPREVPPPAPPAAIPTAAPQSEAPPPLQPATPSPPPREFPPPPPSLAGPLAPSPSAPLQSPPATSPRRGPGGFVRLYGGPELGALPRVTGAVGLAGGLLWRRARLELQGLYLAPRSGDSPRGALRVSLAAGALHGCARPGRGVLEVPLCGGLELGAMRGSIVGGRSAANWWLAAVLGAGVAVHVHPRWSVWGALQLVTGIVKPNYEARDPGPAQPLFQSAAASGRLLLGVEVKISDPR